MARKTLLKPSTRAFIEEARRTPGYSLFDWVHGYVYCRWPYLYIGIGTGEHPLARVFGPLVRWLAQLFCGGIPVCSCSTIDHQDSPLARVAGSYKS